MDGINISELAAIIDSAKGVQGWFASQLESAFTPFIEKLQNIKQDPRTIDVATLFNLEAQDKKRFQQKYVNALKKFLNVFGKKIAELNSTSVSDLLMGSRKGSKRVGPPPLPTMQVGPPPLPEQKISGAVDETKSGFTRNATPVHLESINDDILKTLGSMSPTNNVKVEAEVKGEDSGGSGGGWFGKLLKGLGIAAAVALGGLLLYEAFKTDGKLKGFLKIVGLKLIKGIMPFLDNIAKSMLRVIRTMLRPITAVLGGIRKKAFGLAKGIIGKIPILGGLLKKLGGLGAKAGARIALGNIPIVGSLINFAFAFSRFKSGDAVGGLLEMGAGIAGLLYATPLAPLAPFLVNGINFFLMFRDLTTTRNERKSSFGDIFGGLKKFFMKLPVVQSFANLFGGFYKIFTSKSGADVDAGIAQLKQVKLLHVLFPWASVMFDIIEFLWNSPDFNAVVGKTFDFIGMLAKKFWNFFYGIGEFIGNIIVNILDSNAFQSVKLKAEKMFLYAKKGIYTAIESIVGIIGWLGEKAFSIVDNWAFKKVIGTFSDDLVDDIESTSRNISAFKNLDFTSNIDDDIKEKNRLIAELDLKEMQRQEDMKHQEQQTDRIVDAVNNSGAANVQAANGTTQAVALSNSNRSDRSAGNTQINMYDSYQNSIRRVRDAVFRQTQTR